jgi:hypothetical protein
MDPHHDYMLVSKVQKARSFKKGSEIPFARMPVRGEAVENITNEVLAVRT